jgi:hypothetical protein
MGPRILRRHAGEPDSPDVTAPTFTLTPQQVLTYETFGFVVLRGLFADDMPRLIEGFEEVFAREEAQVLDPDNEFHQTDEPGYERETRWIIPSFIDRSEHLDWLRHDGRLDGIARDLLGDDYLYAESDGNLFNCNVYWHMDAYGAAADVEHVKAFFYLDALRHDFGALRVIPGSHHRGKYRGALMRRLVKDPAQVPELFGIGTDEIPSWTLEIDPGDVIVANFRTLHGSFNGGVRRRLFTVNYRAAAPAPE